ncbi:MAG: hypothetical protein ACLFTH_01325 [Candidatus Woesearchaeota archaeon]
MRQPGQESMTGTVSLLTLLYSIGITLAIFILLIPTGITQSISNNTENESIHGNESIPTNTSGERVQAILPVNDSVNMTANETVIEVYNETEGNTDKNMTNKTRRSNITSYFISLDKENYELSDLDFSTTINTSKRVETDQPIPVTHNVTVDNDLNKTTTRILRLQDILNASPELVSAMSSIEIRFSNTRITDRKEIPLRLEPGEKNRFSVHYTIPPPDIRTECNTRNLEEILPADARITDSDFSSGLFEIRSCTLKITGEHLSSLTDIAYVPDWNISADEDYKITITDDGYTAAVENGLVTINNTAKR